MLVWTLRIHSLARICGSDRERIKNVLRLDHERYHSTNGDQGRARKELNRFDCDYEEGNEKYNLRR